MKLTQEAERSHCGRADVSRISSILPYTFTGRPVARSEIKMRQFPPLTYPPLLPFSYFPFPLEVGPLPRLRLNWSGGALKLPRRAWVKPDRLTQFGLSKTRLGTTSLVLLYKSLFAEKFGSDTETIQHKRKYKQKYKIQRSSPSHHHSSPNLIIYYILLQKPFTAEMYRKLILSFLRSQLGRSFM